MSYVYHMSDTMLGLRDTSVAKASPSAQIAYPLVGRQISNHAITTSGCFRSTWGSRSGPGD